MGATVTRSGQSARPSDRYGNAFAARVEAGPPLLLDGATGTELERRGATSALPLWSARALLEDPALVEQIHRDYVDAGAEILTANTFRTQARTLARAGLAHRARELTALAVALARRAGPERRPWVAGSMAPLEDCFRPDLVPDDDALAHEHREHALALRDAGVDLLLVETMNTAREAAAAARAARETGLPLWTSFTCDGSGRLPSGEPLDAALAAVAPWSPELVGVNCLSPSAADSLLPALAATGRPFAVYANLGAPAPDGSWHRCGREGPGSFAAHALRWVAAGARAVGGCCGTTPDHVRAIARALAGESEGPDTGG
jgi:S-methylmethionine-dependent homocysteine/selenocysteine methylase